MILLIDNNDSFTFNVLQTLRSVTDDRVDVVRAQDVDLECVDAYSHLIFSPGPGLPSDFVIMGQILRKYDNTKSILGICLGHQAICEYYGAHLVNLNQVFHGVKSVVNCDCESQLFSGQNRMIVGRYHSWVARNLPETLRVTAQDETGEVMAVEHSSKRVYGVQFHPESYITEQGDLILKRFVDGATK